MVSGGCRERLTDDQRDLAAANLRLVHWFAKRYRCPLRGYWREEYLSRLQDSLLSATRTHNPARSPFGGYAVRKMFSARRDFLKLLAFRGRHDPIRGEEPPDPFARESDPMRSAAVKEELARCQMLATEREWDVLVRRHMAGETLGEVAALLATSERAVRWIEERARAKVRARLPASYAAEGSD